MNRRRFLIALTALPLAGLITVHRSAPALAGPTGALYRGSSEGRIFKSADGGHTWQACANFGPACSVAEIKPDNDQVLARLDYQGHPFVVASIDGRTWRVLTQHKI